MVELNPYQERQFLWVLFLKPPQIHQVNQFKYLEEALAMEVEIFGIMLEMALDLTLLQRILERVEKLHSGNQTKKLKPKSKRNRI